MSARESAPLSGSSGRRRELHVRRGTARRDVNRERVSRSRCAAGRCGWRSGRRTCRGSRGLRDATLPDSAGASGSPWPACASLAASPANGPWFGPRPARNPRRARCAALVAPIRLWADIENPRAMPERFETPPSLHRRRDRDAAKVAASRPLPWRPRRSARAQQNGNRNPQDRRREMPC